MCVILIGRISKSQHELAKKQNPDGFSMYTKKTGLIKAPTAKQVKEGLYNFGVWHYRIGTSGKLDASNIHPFEVCGGRYLLYHNGILGSGLGEMSDTAALAASLLEVDLKTARSVLNALSRNQRFALVSTKDPRKFELFGEWACEGGILMSHKMYETTYRGYGKFNL